MIFEALKALLIGIVEGITEWLPISSTGHMILVDEFVKLQVSDEFLALFLVVIQIGAIMAVVILYFHKLNPFSRSKTPDERRGTWRLWGMVVVGCIPAAVFGFALDDWVNEHFYNKVTVAAMLVLYGIVFIVLERRNRRRLQEAEAAAAGSRGRHVRPGASAAAAVRDAAAVRGKHACIPGGKNSACFSGGENRMTLSGDEGLHLGSHGKVTSGGPDGSESAGGESGASYGKRAEAELFKITSVDDIDWKTALKIGFFQVLAIVPGTSRSGATIIGGMLAGCSRTAAAEFTFFLAIPVMFGWGLVKVVKFVVRGLAMSSVEIAVLVVGIVSAFVMSVVSIRFLMGYIKKNDFTAFGWYRIAVGAVVLAYFAFECAGLLP